MLVDIGDKTIGVESCNNLEVVVFLDEHWHDSHQFFDVNCIFCFFGVEVPRDEEVVVQEEVGVVFTPVEEVLFLGGESA